MSMVLEIIEIGARESSQWHGKIWRDIHPPQPESHTPSTFFKISEDAKESKGHEEIETMPRNNTVRLTCIMLWCDLLRSKVDNAGSRNA